MKQLFNKLPNIHISQLPPLFYISLGGFLALSLSAFLFLKNAGQTKDAVLNNLGEVLVNWAAHDAAMPIANENLVALQGLLQNIHSQPRVQMVAVHNPDQLLMGQAGVMPPGGTQKRMYTATISHHDSLAGHVTLVLDPAFPGEGAVAYSSVLAAILLLLTSIYTLYDSHGQAWRLVPRAHSNENDDALEWSDDIEGTEGENDRVVESLSADSEQLHGGIQEGEDEESLGLESETQSDDAEPSLVDSDWRVEELYDSYTPIVLLVSLENFHQLKRMLSKPLFEEKIQRFWLKLEKVSEVYAAQHLEPCIDDKSFQLEFGNLETDADAVERALSVGHLLMALEAQEKLGFTLNLYVGFSGELTLQGQAYPGLYANAGLLTDELQLVVEQQPLEGGKLHIKNLGVGLQTRLEHYVEQFSQSTA